MEKWGGSKKWKVAIFFLGEKLSEGNFFPISFVIGCARLFREKAGSVRAQQEERNDLCNDIDDDNGDDVKRRTSTFQCKKLLERVIFHNRSEMQKKG